MHTLSSKIKDNRAVNLDYLNYYTFIHSRCVITTLLRNTSVNIKMLLHSFA